MSRARKYMILAGALALIVVLLIVVGPKIQQLLFYPTPRGLPPTVNQDTEQLLARLLAVLETNAPAVAQSLRPGLSSDQITELETRGGFNLTDELRTLYRWRNGMRTNGFGLLPGHDFPPLEEVVLDRTGLHHELKSNNGTQRAAFSVFAGHVKNWVSIFPDGSGDGYFFDPARASQEGAFFYHFAEDGHYLWFPSFRNFLAGTIEGFETRVFRLGTNETVLDEDYERSQKIWERFAGDSLTGK